MNIMCKLIQLELLVGGSKLERVMQESVLSVFNNVRRCEMARRGGIVLLRANIGIDRGNLPLIRNG